MFKAVSRRFFKRGINTPQGYVKGKVAEIEKRLLRQSSLRPRPLIDNWINSSSIYPPIVDDSALNPLRNAVLNNDEYLLGLDTRNGPYGYGSTSFNCFPLSNRTIATLRRPVSRTEEVVTTNVNPSASDNSNTQYILRLMRLRSLWGALPIGLANLNRVSNSRFNNPSLGNLLWSSELTRIYRLNFITQIYFPLQYSNRQIVYDGGNSNITEEGGDRSSVEDSAIDDSASDDFESDGSASDGSASDGSASDESASDDFESDDFESDDFESDDFESDGPSFRMKALMLITTLGTILLGAGAFHPVRRDGVAGIGLVDPIDQKYNNSFCAFSGWSVDLSALNNSSLSAPGGLLDGKGSVVSGGDDTLSSSNTYGNIKGGEVDNTGAMVLYPTNKDYISPAFGQLFKNHWTASEGDDKPVVLYSVPHGHSHALSSLVDKAAFQRVVYIVVKGEKINICNASEIDTDDILKQPSSIVLPIQVPFNSVGLNYCPVELFKQIDKYLISDKATNLKRDKRRGDSFSEIKNGNGGFSQSVKPHPMLPAPCSNPGNVNNNTGLLSDDGKNKVNETLSSNDVDDGKNKVNETLSSNDVNDKSLLDSTAYLRGSKAFNDSKSDQSRSVLPGMVAVGAVGAAVSALGKKTPVNTVSVGSDEGQAFNSLEDSIGPENTSPKNNNILYEKLKEIKQGNDSNESTTCVFDDKELVITEEITNDSVKLVGKYTVEGDNKVTCEGGVQKGYDSQYSDVAKAFDKVYNNGSKVPLTATINVDLGESVEKDDIDQIVKTMEAIKEQTSCHESRKLEFKISGVTLEQAKNALNLNTFLFKNEGSTLLDQLHQQLQAIVTPSEAESNVRATSRPRR